MATLGELTRQHTDLDRDEIDHLQRLIGEWGLLADLSFADLLLYVPGTDGKWYVVAHVRPATGQTIYHYDYVGTVAAGQELPLLTKAFGDGEIVEGELVVEGVPEPVRMMAVPVRMGDQVIAVLTREWSSRSSRQPGELERTYVGMFQRFGSMISEGTFPFHGPVADSSAAPRVGDGVMALDEDARVRFASPNAVSALHRVGIGANAVGMRLAELGFNDSPVRLAYETKLPVIEEFEQTSDVILLVRCMPVLATVGDGETRVTGGLLLVRDVTEVRKRDKLLLSKDATIREIHHRVKNNLQTISSLLRLQGRRLEEPSAKLAIEESVRRIRSIALVHEALSRDAGDDVSVVAVLRPLIRMVEEGLVSSDHPIGFVVEGDGGVVSSPVATGLSVVLSELLQNAVEHAFPPELDPGPGGGQVQIRVSTDGYRLRMTVADNGVGIPEPADRGTTASLGLSIVTTLVESELGGSISFERGEPARAGHGGPGTLVSLDIPCSPGLG